MADDWQVGDLALCVIGGPRGCIKSPHDEWPVHGRVYTVSSVLEEYFLAGMVGPIELIEMKTALELENGPSNVDSSGTRNSVWPAERFRKVTPPEADEFDRETIDLMNGAPVGEPVA